jgi:hypothetical protein
MKRKKLGRFADFTAWGFQNEKTSRKRRSAAKTQLEKPAHRFIGLQ